MVIHRPDPPTNLNASYKGNGIVALSWTPPDYDEHKPVTNNIIEFSWPLIDSWFAIPSQDYWQYKEEEKTLISVNITGLINGDEYDFRIRSENSAGQSDPSSIIRVMMKYTAPSIPIDLTVTVLDATHLKILWKKPVNDGGKPINGYGVRRQNIEKKEDWFDLFHNTNSTNIEFIDEIQEFDIVQYEIRSINETGHSEYTKPVSNFIPASKEKLVSQYFGSTEKVEAGIQPEITLTEDYDPNDYVGDPIIGIIGNTSHKSGTRYIEFVVIRRKKIL